MPPVSSPRATPHDQHTAVLDALPRVSFRERRSAVPADRPAPGRYLELEDGDERVLLPLGPGATRIGRGFSSDVVLEDPSVSRRHAIVVQRPAGARILDDRSSNGTHVNGVRVEAADLADGDAIVLGRVVLTYRDVR